MLIPTNRGFKRQYVYGGSGIFDSISGFFSKMFTGGAAKQLASSALSVGKTAAKDVGLMALNAGKTAALDAGKKLIEKSVTKILTPKSQAILQKHAGIPMERSSPNHMARKAQDIFSKYINSGAQNINSLIDGSGIAPQKAIAIQELIKRLNTGGSGLKCVC